MDNNEILRGLTGAMESTGATGSIGTPEPTGDTGPQGYTGAPETLGARRVAGDFGATGKPDVTQGTPPATEPVTPPTQSAPETPPAIESPKPEEPPKTQDKPPDKSPDAADEVTRLKGRMAAMEERTRTATARAAAAELGIRPDRIEQATRLADLNGIDIFAPDAAEQIGAALKKVADALPEFKAGAGTGSLGGHPRQSMTAEDQARADFVRGLNM